MDLAFLDDRLVTVVSIKIFLVFLFHVYILLLFVVCFFFWGGGGGGFNVSESNQMYEILG